MPDFFTFNKDTQKYMWGGKKYKNPVLEFYEQLKSGKGSKIALDWFNSIYEIAKEIKFMNSNSVGVSNDEANTHKVVWDFYTKSVKFNPWTISYWSKGTNWTYSAKVRLKYGEVK